MKKRRPIAKDREIADLLRRMPSGRYILNIEGSYLIEEMPLAALKIEGSAKIRLENGGTIFISPITSS
jgi:hypothetical protein